MTARAVLQRLVRSRQLVRSYRVIKSGAASPNALNAAGCDPKIAKLFSENQLQGQPFRLFAPPGPSFGWLCRVTILLAKRRDKAGVSPQPACVTKSGPSSLKNSSSYPPLCPPALRTIDQEIVHLLACLKLRHHPPRLLTATSPSL